MKPRTTDDIRNWACGGRDWLEDQFDRWLSELIRKEREEAVDRYAAQVIEHVEKYGTTVDVEPWPENPYRKE